MPTPAMTALLGAHAGGAGGGYAAEVLADSPTAYWRLEEPSGTSATDEVGSYNATIVGGPTMGQTGQVDDAILFDGSNDHLSCTTLGSLGASLGSITVEFWIKTTTAAQTVPAGVLNDGATTGFLLSLNTNNVAAFAADRIRVFARDNNGLRVDGHFTAAVFNGAWHHIVTQLDASTNAWSAWVDGSSAAVAHSLQENIATFSNFAYPLFCGGLNNRGTLADPAAVSLDEIAVYSTLLSSARILAHYNAA